MNVFEDDLMNVISPMNVLSLKYGGSSNNLFSLLNW